MASSPEEPLPPAEQDVRWPVIATIGVALAVITLVAGVVAALVAAFVIERDDDERSARAPSAVVAWGEDPYDAGPGAAG